MSQKIKIINVKYDNMYICGAMDDEGRTPLIRVIPGLRVILYSETYTGPSNCHARCGEEHWHMMDYNSHPDGVPGNLDTSSCALGGWRGTTDDWSCHAHGVWEVISVGASRRWEERPEPRWGFSGVRMVRVELRKLEA